MEFGFIVCGEDDEHTGVGFVEISKTFSTQNANLVGMESVDKIHH